jgi:hypothetical protein
MEDGTTLGRKRRRLHLPLRVDEGELLERDPSEDFFYWERGGFRDFRPLAFYIYL